MSLRRFFTFIIFFTLFQAYGQETFPVNGVFDEREVYHAFTNATVHVSPTEVMDSAVLLLLDGKIISITNGGQTPEGAVVHDCAGLIIYPSFIDPDAIVKKAKKPGKGKKTDKQKPRNFKAANWNPAIHPEIDFDLKEPIPQKQQDEWMSLGFGLLNLHHRDGIMRGTSSVLGLGEEQANLAIVKRKASNHFSFRKGTSTVDYPTSHIGAIALVRQTLYDSEWYGRTVDKKEFNLSLEALQTIKERPAIFELNHPLSIRNTDELSEEFDLPFVVRGTGKEYLVRQEIKPGSQIIAPLSFPKPFEVVDPFVARLTGLDQLKHWELAPFNMKLLLEVGAEICLTRDTVKAKDFTQNLARISKTGVSHSELLAALTVNPARVLGLENEVGSLNPGKRANFFLSKGEVGTKEFEIVEHWTNGRQAYRKSLSPMDLIGKYDVVVEEKEYEIIISKISEKGIESEIKSDEDKVKRKVVIKIERELITMNIGIEESSKLEYSLSGKLSFNRSVWDGRGQTSEGKWINWAAIRDRKYEAEEKEKSLVEDSAVAPSITFPNVAYGWDSIDENNTFIITNAIVWTCADTGILENADVYVVDGRIKSVGSGQLFPSDVRRIDARGRHLTPGIIDSRPRDLDINIRDY